MKLPIKAQSLAAIREARGYSEGDVAEALDVSIERVRDFESGSELPTKGVVLKLAELFFVPQSLFFSNNVSLEKNIADFRTPRNAPAKVGKGGLRQITQCVELQDVLLEVLPRLDLNFFSTNISLAVRDDIDEAGELVSDFLDLGSHGFFLESDPRELFLIVRKIIEKKKIVVIAHRLASETFRGFCLAERQSVPLIFVNTFDQTNKTKLFTLVHELVHIFLRRDGVSDPFNSDTRIERFCNGVAARVLMPEPLFREVFSKFSSTKDPVLLTRLISVRIGLSLHAIALRIEELGLREGFYENWRRLIWRRYKDSPMKVWEDGSDDESEDEETFILRASSARKLLNRFGFRLALIFGSAIERNILSPSDGERLVGLSSHNLPRAIKFAEQEFGKEI